jgi:hypothetical protein
MIKIIEDRDPIFLSDIKNIIAGEIDLVINPCHNRFHGVETLIKYYFVCYNLAIKHFSPEFIFKITEIE